jgi:hypothetical protein
VVTVKANGETVVGMHLEETVDFKSQLMVRGSSKKFGQAVALV